MLLLLFSGLFLFRFETRQLEALLFQLPPRMTRFEPMDEAQNLCLPQFFKAGYTHNPKVPGSLQIEKSEI